VGFSELPQGPYGAILADPPWRFKTWNKRTVLKPRWGPKSFRDGSLHYRTLTLAELSALPVAGLAGADCALFLWVSWPQLPEALSLIETWGFRFKTCAFCWTKARNQLDLLGPDDQMGMGYWTRANTEACLLATRGRPRRLHADVRQAIIEPRREHSRKPACVHERIERLVRGPYVELFGRRSRPGWTVWGDEVGKFDGCG
jgi:N6-adenosine-specific RNA methylase IME4